MGDDLLVEAVPFDQRSFKLGLCNSTFIFVIGSPQLGFSEANTILNGIHASFVADVLRDEDRAHARYSDEGQNEPAESTEDAPVGGLFHGL